MTPLRKLNYKYSALRWSVTGSLENAARILDQWAYPGIAVSVREAQEVIKKILQAQYEHDKKVLLANLNKTDKVT